MSIGKSLLTMTQDELRSFVSARRKSRSTHEWQLGPRGKVKQVTVAQLSRLLGVSKVEVIKRLEETLLKKDENKT